LLKYKGVSFYPCIVNCFRLFGCAKPSCGTKK
jgi:hypothetical protein